MLVQSVEIRNFRSIREQPLECTNLTALVGRNGSGKSSFLQALDIFYDIAAPLSEEDFFDHDVHSPIEIRVTFGNLRTEELEEFRSYIRDSRLIVTKRILYEDGRMLQRYYAAALQIPIFGEIRAISGKKDRIKAWNDLVASGELSGLTAKIKAADEIGRLMAEYEGKHPDLMQPIEREEQFFGPRNIGGGKLDKYTKYVLVPAVREASEEAGGRKGAIYQLLDMIVLRKVNARKDIQEFKSEFEGKVKALYSSENLTELPELGVSISQTLEKFAPGSQLNLKWDEIVPPEIKLPTAKATLVEDNFEGEISRKGHGLQRALIVTLLQHLAMIPTRQPTEEMREESVALVPRVTETVQGPDLILAIEEPELYLHPSRCRYLSDLLFQLTEKPGMGLGTRNQIIYATHSPYFVDLLRFDKIRMVRKVFSLDSVVPESIVTSFTMEQARKNLAEVCNVEPAKFTKDGFRARAMSVVNTIVGEGFFADVVVVVEGQAEVGALWKLQEVMGKNWSRLGISIVPAGGKNNIDRPVIIFQGFKIPTYFIFDADSQLMGDVKKEREAKERNHCYLRLANAPLEDFPHTQVHKTWAVFKEELENLFIEELGNASFTAIRDQVASELGYSKPSQALKNIEGAARLVECVYDDGKKLPTLEAIIEAITRLSERHKRNADV
jgi:energy-coupling factor transporter ATP-binding protein EcfA2